MSFDEIPENKVETYPCPNCEGGVTKQSDGSWECDNCEWSNNDEDVREVSDES